MLLSKESVGIINLFTIYEEYSHVKKICNTIRRIICYKYSYKVEAGFFSGKESTDKNPALKKYGDAKVVAKKLKKKRSRKRDSEA